MSVRIHLQSHPKLRALLAAALLVAGPAAQGQSCTFVSAGSAISFPPLDPSVAATLTAFMDIQVRCIPASVAVTWGLSGANGSTPLRMKHGSQDAYIPYAVSTISLDSGSTRTWRMTGTVLAANYQNAPVGSYSDILRATILP